MTIFKILGFLFISVAIYSILYKYSKIGLMIFFEIPFLTALLWMLSLGLYDLGLSVYYNPTITINIVSFIIIFNFAILNSSVKISKRQITNVNEKFIEPSKESIHNFFLLFIFLLSIISYILTERTYGFRINLSNSINKQEYVFGYFYNFLPAICGLFYIKFRYKNNIIFIILFLISMAMIISSMNRGLVLFAIIIILYYEILILTKSSTRLSLNIIIISIFIAIIFVLMFSFLGSLRMKVVLENIYRFSKNHLFGLSENFPSQFADIYMYISSPLENASHILNDQKVTIDEYTFFNRLFYPFIKLLSNIIGKSSNYKKWIQNAVIVYPYLEPFAGLNVSSFIADAIQDFGPFGIIVYLFFYDMIWLWISSMLNYKMYGISKIIIFAYLANCFFWSVFTNSVFSMGNLWVNSFVIYVIDILTRKSRNVKIRIKNS